jgi:hypothetical protein
VRRLVLVLIVCVCLLYGYMYVLAATTSVSDLLECKAIASTVELPQAKPQSAPGMSRDAIYCSEAVDLPFPIKYDRVSVYGVTDTAGEDKIVRTLQDFRQQSHTRRIRVEFYKAENWQTWSDPKTGNKGRDREPETLVKSVWLK